MLSSGLTWLIGGTQESAQLAQCLANAEIPCLVSVTTESARKLYPLSPWIQVWVGCLDATLIKPWLQDFKIVSIVDASHPYAIQISQLAIAAAQALQIPYLRYERPEISASKEHTALIEPFTTVEALLNSDRLLGERVLLTLGYRALPAFSIWQARSTLYARILPSPTALAVAESAGFSSDRLIALRPPLSEKLEAALWQHWQISLVVTKASGTAGGEDIKHRVSNALKIPLVVIDRPQLSYPFSTQVMEDAVRFCQASAGSQNL
jgi:precorrin-6A/cobalt-precorrin-6A reductase